MNSETPKQDNDKTVNTQISAVTVYTNQALVTRRGTVVLNGQERELVIAGLPVTIQTDSVRATGAGTVAVRLLGVSTERIYTTVPVAERVAQISQEIQQLDEQKRSIQDALTSLNLRRNFVQSLSEKSVERFSRSLALQQVGLDETRGLLNFVGEQYNELSGAIAQQEKQQHDIEKHLQAKRQQLQQVLSPRPNESFNIIVTIEATAAGDFELEVSYVVTQANWNPLYDLRVNSGGNTLNLSYLAEVQQNTGEDWMGVALTLSTAKPGLGTLPPKLKPWYIDLYVPQPPGTALRARAETTALFAQAAPALGAPTAEVFQVETVVAEVSTEGGVVTFGLDVGSNIPSDGAPHKVTIFSNNYPYQLQYVCIPKLVSFAYLQATVTNPENGVTLLTGKANIFRDNTFVGTTQLENIAPGQEFNLNLGIDESLKIERNLVERQVDKKLIGNQRRITYAYRLAVTNLRDRQVNLKLIEQLPVSRNEKIKLRLIRTNPQIPLGEMGMLEWLLIIPPQSKQELYYQFTVEYPPELTVVGLEI